MADRDGLVLTNRHVIETGRAATDELGAVVGWDVVLVFGGPEPLIIEKCLAQQSATVDLAWIRVDHQFGKALGFAETPAPGRPVYAYGFPSVASQIVSAELNAAEYSERLAAIERQLEAGRDPDLMQWLGEDSMALSVTSGIVSAVHETEAGVMLQTDAFIHNGNSGGPLVDQSGRVIGIATLRATAVESANFCLGGRTVFEELAHETGIVWPDSWD